MVGAARRQLVVDTTRRRWRHARRRARVSRQARAPRLPAAPRAARGLFEDFIGPFHGGQYGVSDAYPAGEAPIVAADGRSLARALCIAGKVAPTFVEKTAEMRAAVLSRVRDGDVVITMGAGSIAGLAPELAVPAGPVRVVGS
jgi:UDP-N-acetylmuramate--alanine ligase